MRATARTETGPTVAMSAHKSCAQWIRRVYAGAHSGDILAVNQACDPSQFALSAIFILIFSVCARRCARRRVTAATLARSAAAAWPTCDQATWAARTRPPPRPAAPAVRSDRRADRARARPAVRRAAARASETRGRRSTAMRLPTTTTTARPLPPTTSSKVDRGRDREEERGRETGAGVENEKRIAISQTSLSRDVWFWDPICFSRCLRFVFKLRIDFCREKPNYYCVGAFFFREAKTPRVRRM